MYSLYNKYFLFFDFFDFYLIAGFITIGFLVYVVFVHLTNLIKCDILLNMKNYKIDWKCFEQRFPTEKHCNDYLKKLKWNGNFQCVRCGSTDYWDISEIKFKCKNCGYQSTITSGTMFQNTHLSMLMWFRSIWYIVACNGAVNATLLQKELNIGSNRTTLNVINKIREVMKAIDSLKLSGKIYIDYIPIFNRTIKDSKDVYFAISHNGETFQRIKMQLKKTYNQNDIGQFIENNIIESSTLISKKKCFYAYNGQLLNTLPKGYKYKYTDKISEDEILPPIKIVMNYLKDKELLSIHQGICSLAHSESYLSECCYKFNKRNRKPEQMFAEILKFMVQMSNNS